MGEQNKKRNIYIDIMKGLLITLVVIGHLPYFEYDSRTLTLIYSFHMHAFLIIGGMLSHISENTKLATILYKRIKGTLIPYFIFYLITFIIVPTTTEQKLNAIPVVIKGIGIPPDHALNLPLWFLTFYFVAMTVFEILQYFSYKIAKVITNAAASSNLLKAKCRMGELCEPLTLLITFIFISIIMRASFIYARIYKLPRLPYNIEIAGFCLGFVFLGNICGKLYNLSQIKNVNSNPIHTFKNCKSIILKISIAVISIFTLIMISKTWYEYSMWNGRIDLNARDYKNAFYMYVDAILGFIVFAVFAYMISIFPPKKMVKSINSIASGVNNTLLCILDFPKNLFSYLGRNSLYILAFHVPSVFYTNAFIMPFMPRIIRETLSHNSIISIIILTTLGIVFSLICSIILKKTHNFISHKLTISTNYK